MNLELANQDRGRGTEPVAAFRRLEDHLGAVGALPCPIEAGGINSLVPLQVAAALKRPVVDADGMGRAFQNSICRPFTSLGFRAHRRALPANLTTS